MTIIYPYGKQTIDNDDVMAVVNVLKSPWLTQGPRVSEFEKKIADYTGAKYAVVVANGTAALHLAVLATEIKVHDEAITSPLTFAASANCVKYAGAEIGFADIDERSGLIKIEEIEKRLTKRTKLLIPVHYAGQACDMQEVAKLAKEFNLAVIEDAAHALGSTYKNSRIGDCTYSDMSIFSFHPVKTITTGEGGAITTNSKKLYDKLCLLRTHGISRDHIKPQQNNHTKEPWYYEMQELGFNYRLTDFQAALGTSQLAKITKFINIRSALVREYRRFLGEDERFNLLPELPDRQTAYHLWPVRLNLKRLQKSKSEIAQKLMNRWVGVQVHYLPVHLHPYYQSLGFKKGDFPKAEFFSDSVLSLPLYPLLTLKDVQVIVEILKKAVD